MYRNLGNKLHNEKYAKENSFRNNFNKNAIKFSQIASRCRAGNRQINPINVLFAFDP